MVCCDEAACAEKGCDRLEDRYLRWELSLRGTTRVEVKVRRNRSTAVVATMRSRREIERGREEESREEDEGRILAVLVHQR